MRGGMRWPSLSLEKSGLDCLETWWACGFVWVWVSNSKNFGRNRYLAQTIASKLYYGFLDPRKGLLMWKIEYFCLPFWNLHRISVHLTPSSFFYLCPFINGKQTKVTTPRRNLAIIFSRFSYRPILREIIYFYRKWKKWISENIHHCQNWLSSDVCSSKYKKISWGRD